MRHREFIEKRTMEFSGQERARTKVPLFLRELSPGYMVSYRTREQEAEQKAFWSDNKLHATSVMDRYPTAEAILNSRV